MLISKTAIIEISKKLSIVKPRDRTGEKFEELLASVLLDSVRFPKDKKWFDVRWHGVGIECKTFKFNKVVVGESVDNVLKRVSQVNSWHNNSLRNPTEVGKDIINYLHTTVAQHAKIKEITGQKILSVLARCIDDITFAYWEEPLHFGSYIDYTWTWEGKNTLVGAMGRERIFNWYQNQKQLFYHWKIPNNAIIFVAGVCDNVEMPKTEFQLHIKKSYISGYKDGIQKIKPKYNIK